MVPPCKWQTVIIDNVTAFMSLLLQKQKFVLIVFGRFDTSCSIVPFPNTSKKNVP